MKSLQPARQLILGVMRRGSLMHYHDRAYRLAEERGYLRFPEVLARETEVPGWFHLLGADKGVAELEGRRGIRLPASLKEFYRCIPLACFLDAAIDGEVFLLNMHEPDPPPLVDWKTGKHLVVAFHNHSGGVCGVALTGDDPPTAWGSNDQLFPDALAGVTFSDWVLHEVFGYELRLDYWQGVYEHCLADPAESLRLGGAKWVLHMPGMKSRLAKLTERGAAPDRPREGS